MTGSPRCRQMVSDITLLALLLLVAGCQGNVRVEPEAAVASVKQRRPPPVTCSNLPMATSARARMAYLDAFRLVSRPSPACHAMPRPRHDRQGASSPGDCARPSRSDGRHQAGGGAPAAGSARAIPPPLPVPPATSRYGSCRPSPASAPRYRRGTAPPRAVARWRRIHPRPHPPPPAPPPVHSTGAATAAPPRRASAGHPAAGPRPGCRARCGARVGAAGRPADALRGGAAVAAPVERTGGGAGGGGCGRGCIRRSLATARGRAVPRL